MAGKGASKVGLAEKLRKGSVPGSNVVADVIETLNLLRAPKKGGKGLTPKSGG
jgi:hypothetical protein